jgi:hypothetical protein
MAKKKIKIGKLLIVTFLTVLIWVWADRAKTEEFTISNTAIKIDTSANPRLWITINNKTSAPIDKVVFEGSSASIDKVQREQRENKLKLEFFINSAILPELEEPGTHSINVSDCLKKSADIRQLGLTIKSCEPAKLNVQVYALAEKELNIDCLDPTGLPRKVEHIEPSKVKIPVPEEWVGNAKITLTAEEINQAKSSPIKKIPFVELQDGQTRASSTPVTIKLPPAEKDLAEFSITKPTIGYVFSPNLAGKYNVQLLNQQELTVVVNIKATPDAKQAYEDRPYQILLYISDSDTQNPQTEKRRKVDYNWPKQYFQNGEIRLNGEPKEAVFKLVPASETQPAELRTQ